MIDMAGRVCPALPLREHKQAHASKSQNQAKTEEQKVSRSSRVVLSIQNFAAALIPRVAHLKSVVVSKAGFGSTVSQARPRAPCW